MNVPHDWYQYYVKCEFCGKKYHESELYCSCTDSFEECHCGFRQWIMSRGIIICEECGSKPGEVFDDEI